MTAMFRSAARQISLIVATFAVAAPINLALEFQIAPESPIIMAVIRLATTLVTMVFVSKLPPFRNSQSKSRQAK